MILTRCPLALSIAMVNHRIALGHISFKTNKPKPKRSPVAKKLKDARSATLPSSMVGGSVVSPLAQEIKKSEPMYNQRKSTTVIKW